jgi:hypothetical protein
MCLDVFCGGEGVNNGASEVIAAGTTEKPTFIVITAADGGQLPFGRLPAPFTAAAIRSIVNGDGP